MGENGSKDVMRNAHHLEHYGYQQKRFRNFKVLLIDWLNTIFFHVRTHQEIIRGIIVGQHRTRLPRLLPTG